tara:strand:- start:2 stop:475 length:474 start_codon:yes stop_codon:yes gene_type:complete
MELKGILAISGYKGLFKHISEGKNAIIVESLEDKTRMPAYAAYKISSLEDISIYTEDEDASLNDIFEKMFKKENGGQCPDHKSPSGELKEYFSSILPNYDQDRVYVSDIKKILNWYNILQKLDMLKFEEEKAQDKVEEKGETETENNSEVNNVKDSK